MKVLNIIDWVALVLLVIGGFNWGLIGAAKFNLVEYIFGFSLSVVNIIYTLVGISAIYIALIATRLQKCI